MGGLFVQIHNSAFYFCLGLSFAATGLAQQPMERDDSMSGMSMPGMSMLNTTTRPMHTLSEQRDNSAPPKIEPAALPDGMTLDQALQHSAQERPADWPPAIMDDGLYAFMLVEQLEYRVPRDQTPNRIGWDAQGWIGRDLDKLWIKPEGEVNVEGQDQGETTTDVLYSRLVTPFWNLQGGIQYANQWSGGTYDDTWAGVIALQGIAPYQFDFDNSLYVSENGDVWFDVTVRYDLRITQRLVLEPRAEVTIYAQDNESQNIGAGPSDLALDLRLRYEIKREFAPYVGVRFHTLLGETSNLASAAGEDTQQFMFLAGLRFAF